MHVTNAPTPQTGQVTSRAPPKEVPSAGEPAAAWLRRTSMRTLQGRFTKLDPKQATQCIPHDSMTNHAKMSSCTLPAHRSDHTEDTSSRRHTLKTRHDVNLASAVWNMTDYRSVLLSQVFSKKLVLKYCQIAIRIDENIKLPSEKLLNRRLVCTKKVSLHIHWLSASM